MSCQTLTQLKASILLFSNAFPTSRSVLQAAGLGEHFAHLNAAAALNWVSMGVQVIGGCCGIGPAHIQLLRERLPAYTPDRTGL